MATIIQLRHGTAAAWTAANPTLADGECGVETDTHKMKIGDGTTAWNSLAYSSAVPGTHTHAESDVTNLVTDLAAKAPLASPALTGVPTAPTATAGTNTTQIATTAYVRGAVSDLVASAPAALDTLNELATALGNDANFSTTVTTALGTKAPTASPTFTGTITTPLGAGYVKSSAGGVLSASAAVAQADVTNLTTDLAAKAPTASPTFTGQVSVPLGTAAAPSIIPGTDTNTGIYSPGADQVGIATAGTARVVVDSSGNVAIGTAVTAAGPLHTAKQGTTGNYFDNAAGQNHLYFRRSQGTIASPTVVSAASQLGAINFQGYDGSTFVTAAQIWSEVDTTPGASDMPGNISFRTTPDGSTTLTERMRIDNAGNVSIGATTAAAQLHLESDSANALRIASNNSTNVSGTLLFVKRRGTAASPTIVASGDNLGQLDFYGFDGGSNRQAAAISATVDGTPGASDMPTRLTFWTTPDGTVTITERMRIDNAGLITGSGTSLGAWTAYAPTLAGTGWAIGNGTIDASSCQVGKIVTFSILITFGTTSTFGSAAATITLPVAMKSSSRYSINAQAVDTSASNTYLLTTTQSSTTVCVLGTVGTNGLRGGVTSTNPFTWASTDVIRVSGFYEIA